MDEIRFTLNGEAVAYDGSAADRLLDVLRDVYDDRSVKCGCKEGECGACAVLIDGELVNSCMVAMGAVDGSAVVTLEGYRETDRFRALDKAFAEVTAVQCGYCIPGMVLAAEATLAKHPHPTDDQIREGLSGNLCRCTGYNAIAQAVANAAEEANGLW
ncbi:(2Fe-2S)-binding protein [Olsenella sp. YH-ols2217]|uniref:(2Fe-2S)-binding protein n=1 Tax=Kribbibacterium absianum TaxID=3044210 RepID=A0ABT6ZHU5_9ACTN|nr:MULTISPECIES: (2Fe-2S)-binding protein [unclassified Olsenella]MDJ1121137.1 (2Fe-2S)-binding protein [Olsenella sp. YH-ols2216]MDJ1128628.1 (2Fe-2S)-binding protein [Olsenella sp. YH-ols2217]